MEVRRYEGKRKGREVDGEEGGEVVGERGE